MLERDSKILLPRRQSGLSKNQKEKNLVVPDNSLSQISAYRGTGINPFNQTTIPNMAPIDMKICSENEQTKCQHCENMAKNFLYLESLIRNNCKKDRCSVCASTLKYLNYVNRSIKSVFGNYDPIVKTANAFAFAGKRQGKKKIQRKSKKSLSTILTMKMGETRVERSEGGANLPLSKADRIKILKPITMKSKVNYRNVEFAKRKPPKKTYIIIKKTTKTLKKKAKAPKNSSPSKKQRALKRKRSAGI